MLNSKQEDEVCDATKVYSSNSANNIKTKFTFLKLSKHEESFKSKFPLRGTGGFEGKEYLVKDGDVMHFRFNV
jgi:ribosome-binding ATPase YchF (GTP1/OBG family)